MSRILLPIGDSMLQAATLDFAAYIAKQAKSDIAIVPLKTPADARLEVPERIAASAGIGDVGLHLAEEATRNGRYQQQMISLCKHSLGGTDIQLQTGSDQGIEFAALLQETRYADLAIVEGNLSPESSALDANPTHYVKALLHDAECPVLVAPLSFHIPDEVLFAYDGSAASMHAIKCFARLFPELCRKKLHILEVYQHREPAREQARLKQWLAANFTDTEFIALRGDIDNRLLEYTLDKYQSIIVMGGYGRGIWSRLLNPSASAAVVKIVTAPVFIAHR